jgi:hypothetical protein
LQSAKLDPKKYEQLKSVLSPLQTQPIYTIFVTPPSLQSAKLDPKMYEQLKGVNAADVTDQLAKFGMTPQDVMQKIMSDPELAEAFQKPHVQKAIMESQTNPEAMNDYWGDPDVMLVRPFAAAVLVYRNISSLLLIITIVVVVGIIFITITRHHHHHHYHHHHPCRRNCTACRIRIQPLNNLKESFPFEMLSDEYLRFFGQASTLLKDLYKLLASG